MQHKKLKKNRKWKYSVANDSKKQTGKESRKEKQKLDCRRLAESRQEKKAEQRSKD